MPSQNEAGNLFGLEDGAKVVGVKVRWPFVQKKGFTSGEVIEKLYPIKHSQLDNHLEVTLCEDGKVLRGKMSCQF